MTEKTIWLKDYTPPHFEIENIELDFDLWDDKVIVKNTLYFKRLLPGSLHLCGDELKLLEISLDDVPLKNNQYRLLDGDLWLDDAPHQGKLVILTEIYPQNNTKLSGLYRSNHLYCTQCEAEGFRRMTFFPDRPDVLTRFKTRIEADKTAYPVLLSNGNLIDSGDLDAGRHWVLWEDPFKKPSYLFALVAGDLACVSDQFVTCSGKTVDLKIYVEKGNEDKCGHAMVSLKKSMRWDEEVYGREYDLSIFMIVAVSDFNMGAMENKGLNIFNAKYILASPQTATDQDFADIEGVVAHEYFHNWTGNRVTCRDWFQLSLKEGLTVFRDQEFSRDMNSRDVNRILDVKVLKAAQFPEDAGAMAHPVRPESYEEINNFYTATIYNKGAEVIRMQHTLLGAEGFRAGMDLYFDRHDGQAVTIDDFVSAMEDANGVDFSQLKYWYSQAGTPKITVSQEFKNNILSLTLTQSCPETPECAEKHPFHIPIKMALFNSQGQQLAIEKDVLELKNISETFHFHDLTEKPVISLLRDFSAPVILEQAHNILDSLALLRFETDGYAKWNAGQSLALDCIRSFFHKNADDCKISDALVTAFRHVLLDESLDMALKAELLTPPGFEEVISGMTIVPVAIVESARDLYRSELGRALYPELAALRQKLSKQINHASDGQVFAQRKLRNVCLWLMMKAVETDILEDCLYQFKEADNMSDQIAAFSLLVNSQDVKVREKAIQDFYRQWSKDELVLDKWFTVQACCESPCTITRVTELLNHPDFSWTNPNKVRSLIGAFTQGNHRHFHAADGSGYAFLTDMLIKIDKINPQIAARLCTPFTRWKRFDNTRQMMMQEQLARLAGMELSRDLQELVSKSLAINGG